MATTQRAQRDMIPRTIIRTVEIILAAAAAGS
jgi:hypothetical protein